MAIRRVRTWFPARIPGGLQRLPLQVPGHSADLEASVILAHSPVKVKGGLGIRSAVSRMRRRMLLFAGHPAPCVSRFSLFCPLTEPGVWRMFNLAAGISAEQMTRHRVRGCPVGRPGDSGPRRRNRPRKRGREGRRWRSRGDAAGLESDRLRRFFSHPALHVPTLSSIQPGSALRTRIHPTREKEYLFPHRRRPLNPMRLGDGEAADNTRMPLTCSGRE